jgi:hypothetical protein
MQREDVVMKYISIRLACNAITKDLEEEILFIVERFLTRMPNVKTANYIINNEDLYDKVSITDECYQDFYTVQCHVYSCPVCKKANVVEGFKFCPECGSKLRWVLSDNDGRYLASGGKSMDINKL